MLAPAVASAIAFILIAINRHHQSVKKPHTILMAYLVATSITWATFFQCYFYPGGYLYTHHLALPAFLMMPVLLYQLIFEATKLESNEKFNYIHYLMPGLISLALGIVSLFTPKEVQLQCITNLGEDPPGRYEPFYLLAANRMRMRLVFSLLYTIMGFQRLRAYRRTVLNYSANDSTTRLSWVFWLLCASVSLILIPFFGTLLAKKALFQSPWLYVQGGIILFMNVYLCVYVARWKRFVYIQDIAGPTGQKMVASGNNLVATQNEGQLVYPGSLNKQHMEQHMVMHKPYLDPALRIATLAADLGVNRTYLSTFINDVYQKNFSCFINSYRYDAFQQLINNPENALLTKAAMAKMSGFISYHSLLRFQKLCKTGGCF